MQIITGKRAETIAPRKCKIKKATYLFIQKLEPMVKQRDLDPRSGAKGWGAYDGFWRV